MQHDSTNPWRVWRDAAQRDAIDVALRGLYAELDAAVAERGPLCNASGRCCKFESFDHRLYVTGLEIAWFVQGVRSHTSQAGQSTAGDDRRGITLHQLNVSLKSQASPPDACPYQVNGLCSTHTIRPLGCRVFFCEEGTEDWQQDTTERFLHRLKQLHAEHELPYSYMEWRAGLAEAGRFLSGTHKPS